MIEPTKDLSLHRKYRPTTLDDMVGNEAVVESLRSILQRKGAKPHSYLFTGPAGCGKTTLARIVRDALGCGASDYYEMNSAADRGIDKIRDLQQKAKLAPLGGKVKVYLFDEAHKLTNDSQNALLKLLEDTPAHVYLLLATTDPSRLIKPLRDRCTHIQVEPVIRPKLLSFLKKIVALEGVPDFPVTILREIVDAANGSPRVCLVLLDKVIDIPDDEIALQAIQGFDADESGVIEVCRALIEPGLTSTQRWMKVRGLLANLRGADPEEIRRACLGYFGSVMMNDNKKMPDPRVPEMMLEFLPNTYDSGMSAVIYACYIASMK